MGTLTMKLEDTGFFIHAARYLNVTVDEDYYWIITVSIKSRRLGRRKSNPRSRR
jgi:hypothetical protein